MPPKKWQKQKKRAKETTPRKKSRPKLQSEAMRQAVRETLQRKKDEKDAVVEDARTDAYRKLHCRTSIRLKRALSSGEEMWLEQQSMRRELATLKFKVATLDKQEQAQGWQRPPTPPKPPMPPTPPWAPTWTGL